MSTTTLFAGTAKEGMRRDLRWFNRIRAKNGLAPYTLRDLAKFQDKAAQDIKEHGRVCFPRLPTGHEECA